MQRAIYKVTNNRSYQLNALEKKSKVKKAAENGNTQIRNSNL